MSLLKFVQMLDDDGGLDGVAHSTKHVRESFGAESEFLAWAFLLTVQVLCLVIWAASWQN